MLLELNAKSNFVIEDLELFKSGYNTQKNIDMMLTDKELNYLKDLEQNKDVVYLLNTRECELISKLIKSYKEVQQQLNALQLSKEI